ncbi:MAG: transglycosylase SLT domain-containing protein [Gemmatimonadetes bacterium]|nr:transglycosylase SLT domain-containing protein [Gemmatimonadota bacterium]
MRRRSAFVWGVVLLLLAGAWRVGQRQPRTLESADAVERPPQSYERELTRYIELAGATESWTAGIEELRTALDLGRKEDHTAAAAAFERVAVTLPGLADWSYLLAAEAAGRAGDTAAVNRLLANTAPLLARERGWRARVQARATAGDSTGALEAAQSASAALENGSHRADAWRWAARLQGALGDSAAALAAWRETLVAAPASTAALEAAGTLKKFRGITPEDRLRSARVYLNHGQVDAAMTAYDAYLRSPDEAQDGPAATHAAVRLEAGRALFRARRYPAAETRLAQLARADDPDSIVAEASLLVGLAQYRRGSVTQARTTFGRTAERFPRERAAAEALFLLGDIEHDAGRLDRARAYYSQAVISGTDPEWSGEAAMRLGALTFLTADHAEALAIFEDLRGARTRGARYQQASYWSGRAYQALGEENLARVRLEEAWREEPASFYGVRAAELLGDAEWVASLAPPSPSSDPQAEKEVAGALARLDALQQLDLGEAVTLELERIKRYFSRFDGGLYALAEGLVAQGRSVDGILLGREIRSGEEQWNDRLLRIVYPFPYRDQIVAAASERGLDPFLVAGLIRQESGFNPRAVSPAGAVGLMQIMPSTGRMLGRRVGIRQVNRSVLQRPEDNIRMGTLFFSELLERYDGRLTDALAAYNAGPRRLAEWRDYPEYQDEDLFAERIPFAETRGFVKVVRQNARLYAELYGGGVRAGSREE